MEVGDFFQAVQDRLAIGIVDLLAAGEVGAALHVTDLQRAVEMLLQKRNVFVEKLLLKILGTRRNDHALAGQQRRDEIRERFSGAGARVHKQVLFFGQRGLYRFRHFQLALTKLVARMPFRQHAVAREKLPGGERFCSRRHHF